MSDGPTRHCPVCDALERTLLHHQRFFEGPLGEGYDVVVCKKCGSGFADGIPSQVELDRYYSAQSKYTYAHRAGMESRWDFKRFETTVSHLAPLIRSREAKILDVGCATGGLLSVMKREGFSNLHGIDPSPVCAETANKLHGVPVTAGTLTDLANGSRRFDVILMLGVLEHVREVRRTLQCAISLLNEEGLLYCAVPDVGGLLDCNNAPYQQFSFEHVNFFSEVSLNNALSSVGLKPYQSWRWKTEWREGVIEPIASGIFSNSPGAALTFDAATLPALQAYLDCSAGDEIRLLDKVHALQASGEAVLIWGAGTLARRLLASSSLAGANIVAFVDSNPQLRGKTLAGKPILAPDQLGSRSEPIVICSQPFRMEILEAMSALGLPNKVISLTG
jgi:SAM-dependent methyltransferase